MRVLIVKLSSIGDVVQTIPAAMALRRGFLIRGVEAGVDWVVEEAASGILEGNPAVDNLFVVKNHGLRSLPHNIGVARAISGRRYDVVLDFQGLLKSGIWVLLSRGRRRIGFSGSREWSHIFLNEKLPPYDPDRHALDRYLDLAGYAAGASANGPSLPLEVGAGELGRVKGLLLRDALLGGEEKFFVLVPRARWKTKLWDDSKFVELGKALYRRAGLHTVIVGGPGEKGLERIKNDIGTAVNLAGKIGLKELAALSGLASFTVSVDSGPMHVLSLHGSRVIALFGPTAPWRTGPYGEGHIVLRSGAECSPCFRKVCSDMRCMREIRVEDVLDAVQKLIPAGETLSRG